MSASNDNTEMSEVITVHVTAEQKREIRITAAKADMNMSEYIRSRLLDD